VAPLQSIIDSAIDKVASDLGFIKLRIYIDMIGMGQT